ncbi:MAG: hypothetical protein M1503_02885 [Thaumarchaeota archaeon]|nr:hypothetical protein [Nitrososphaerota archaeon]MCL5317197.1 hypothetical protein [Nitrososphaerota archaeon]
MSSEPIAKENKDHTPPILPERALSFAWGLTVGNTSSVDAQENAENIRLHLNQIIKHTNELAQKNREAEKDKVYVDNVVAAIYASLRSLQIIYKGRDQNFKEVDEVMDTQIKNIQSYERTARDLQSSLPRLFATGGGAAGTVLVGYIFGIMNINIPEGVIYSAAVLAAGAAYGIYQMIIAPHNAENARSAIIENDYKRNIYYQQYIKRTKKALNSLLDETLAIYENAYNRTYHKNYSDPEERENIVTRILGGPKTLDLDFCPKVHEHYQSGKLTPKVWPNCETSIGNENCPYYTEDPRLKKPLQ